MSFLEIKPHSRRKYNILRKYLGACSIFSQKYKNFAYVDTHGGTGEVIDFDSKKPDDGSVLLAAKLQPNFPCYVAEIDPDNYKLLEQSTKGFPHVKPFFGDCNDKIDDILKMIPRGEKFVFCFLDPDSLMYGAYDQLKWETVDKIAKFPRTEVLINVPTFTIMRCAGVVRDYPEASSSIKMANHLTNFYGSTNWENLEPGDYRGLARLYISERLTDYNYKGAILIRSVLTRGPLYYLVYGSTSERGGQIMRDIMKKEWVESILGYVPITRHQYKTDKEWLDAEYPVSLFIFED